MKTNRAAFFFVLCSLHLILTYGTASASTPPQPDPFNLLLRQGIEKTFNMESVQAISAFQKVVELDRGNPTGYAFLALAHLFLYEMSVEPQDRGKNEEAMLRYIDETMTKGEKRIGRNPQDDQAYFAMALAKIAKIRWAIPQKRYFTITNEAIDTCTYVEKAEKENPKNYDYHFPTGLLHYHLDQLHGMARLFSFWMITNGNSKKGLREMEQVAGKGYLLKELAQAELAAVYLNFEKDPARALPYIQELKKKFPSNYNFSFALANTLSELHRFAEAFAIAQEIGTAIQAGTPPFIPQLQPRYDQLMGKILLDQGEYTQASEYFQKTLKDLSPCNTRIRAWALVRMGMIQDIRKDRKQAVDYYNKSLDMEGGEGAAQVEAQKYLKTPYAPPLKPRVS
jgi:tetratricopeptide (TPR) repeat protein